MGRGPALGRSLINGLKDILRVVALDYEGHVLSTPKPDTLTPPMSPRTSPPSLTQCTQTASRFTAWLALSGLQLAIRTERLSALIMGGFPPVDGPYAEMLCVTTATHEMAIAAQSKPADLVAPAEASPGEVDWSSVHVTMSEHQTRQFMTLYKALQGFDDRAAQARVTCPRLCFAGSADEIEYGERWGNVRVSLARPLVDRRAEPEAYGWDVWVLDGLDHTQAMQAANVLPIVHPWLTAALKVHPASKRSSG